MSWVKGGRVRALILFAVTYIIDPEPSLGGCQDNFPLIATSAYYL